MISKRAISTMTLWLSLFVAGCAAGPEETDVVTSQETTVARCPAPETENERTKPADTVNGGTVPTGPEKEGSTSNDDATVTQPGCDPGKNAGGGFGSRGAAEAAQSSSGSGSGG